MRKSVVLNLGVPRVTVWLWPVMALLVKRMFQAQAKGLINIS